MPTKPTKKPVLVGPPDSVRKYAVLKGWQYKDYISVRSAEALSRLDPPMIAGIILVNAKSMGARVYDDIVAEINAMRRLWVFRVGSAKLPVS